MAIVTARYSWSKKRTRAAIKYIQHRTGRDGERITRELFGFDGQMSREQAYELLNGATKRTAFFRFVISPSQATEDTYQDLNLHTLTKETIHALEKELKITIPFVAAVHDDHADHRHVHLVALVTRRVEDTHLQTMIDTATTEAGKQRVARDRALEQQQQQQEGGQWAGLAAS
jgi:hypothetical protein